MFSTPLILTADRNGMKHLRCLDFYVQKQEPGDTIETFIMDLKTLATNCDYGDIVESLVRDRILW